MGRYRRLDQIVLACRTCPVPGNAAFSFTVESFPPAAVPGLSVIQDVNAVVLFGVLGRPYAVTLTAPGGAVKAAARSTFGIGELAFQHPDGSPVKVCTGDRSG